MMREATVKRFGITFCAWLAVGAAWANAFDDVDFRGATDKASPVDYAVGERIVLSFTLAHAPQEVFQGDYAVDWRRRGDDGRVLTGRLPLDGNTPLSVTTSLDRPGSVFIEATVVSAKDGKPVLRDKRAINVPSWEGDGRSVSFSGGAVVGAELIKPAHDEPDDFDAFWSQQKARLKATPVDVLERKEVTTSETSGCRVWRVKVACAGPRPVTGYLAVPRHATLGSLKGVCHFRGYGTGVQEQIADGRPDCIYLTVNAHGYDLGRDEPYYETFRDGVRTARYVYGFSPWQNEYPEGCYFNGMALRVMRAFEFLCSLPEWDGKRLEAEGASQGGLQALWAAGLVENLTEARLEVPWCADLGGDAVPGRVVADWRIDWTPGIAYYDCANHARRAKCRVRIIRAGLGDTCCLSSGIAALYNCLPKGLRSIVWVQGGTHGYVPPEPNQCVELPSRKIMTPYRDKSVYTDVRLP